MSEYKKITLKADIQRTCAIDIDTNKEQVVLWFTHDLLHASTALWFDALTAQQLLDELVAQGIKPSVPDAEDVARPASSEAEKALRSMMEAGELFGKPTGAKPLSRHCENCEWFDKNTLTGFGTAWAPDAGSCHFKRKTKPVSAGRDWCRHFTKK